MRVKKQEILDLLVTYIKNSNILGMSVTDLMQCDFKLSRQQLVRYLSFLVAHHKLERRGQGKSTRYFYQEEQKELLHKIILLKDASLQGEDIIYEKFVKPQLNGLSKNIVSIIKHGFTEIVNNSIDHSSGQKLIFELKESQEDLILQVADDGVGAFKRNMEAFNCMNIYEAVAELAKGKRTSDPRRHAGEGVFFTARLFEYFSIQANDVEWEYYSKKQEWSMKDLVNCPLGTTVTMKISKSSQVKPEDIFNQYTDEDFTFNKNALFLVEPYKISAGVEPVSRSEAKRFLVGAEKFKHILIDFKNTERIGQGFADEVFRVFQLQHQDIILEPVNMCPAVRAMIKHVKSER